MTYLELIQLIESRGEKVLEEKAHLLRTNKFLYTRQLDQGWQQRELPVIVEEDKFIPLGTHVDLPPKLPPPRKKRGRPRKIEVI